MTPNGLKRERKTRQWWLLFFCRFDWFYLYHTEFHEIASKSVTWVKKSGLMAWNCTNAPAPPLFKQRTLCSKRIYFSWLERNQLWASFLKCLLHTLLEAMTGLTKLTMKKEGSSCTLGLWWVQNKFWLNHRNSYLHHEILKLLFCLNFIKKSIITFFHFCFWSVLRAVMCSFMM